MNVASLIARILFGLAFTVAGAMQLWLAFSSGPPAMPGLAGTFQTALYQSHFVFLVCAAQLFTGICLLVNRFVPLALVVGAALLANILMFHITMMPMGIFPGLILTVCWVLVAMRHRAAFAALLSP